MQLANDPKRWAREISSNARAYGVPEWVVYSTIATESSFDPRAFNPSDPGGARGLMQLLPETARRLGYTGSLGNDSSRTSGLYDPGTSIRLGTRLLGQLRGRWPAVPWDQVYSAYNAGEPYQAPRANLDRWRQWAREFLGTGQDPSPPFGPGPVALSSLGSFSRARCGGCSVHEAGELEGPAALADCGRV